MSKLRERIEKEKTMKWYEKAHPIWNVLFDLVMVAFTVCSTWIGLQGNNITWWNLTLLAVFSLLIITYKVRDVIKDVKYNNKYAYYRKTEEVSVATLQAFKDANEMKRRTILQSTYGNVPYWHPTNYIDNVLVYDVHEHIRTILYGLQKLVINMVGLNDDQVTVDLVYCYPEEAESDSNLPVKNKEKSGKDSSKKENVWRLITSGNHSLGGSIHYFLEEELSFYNYVDHCGYAFYNDKMDCVKERHYILSERDREYNCKGSIVGLKIELKNDAPEKVFVKAILTITTYKRKLYEKESLKEEDFKDIFKENVLSSYKSQFMSEMAQMYIRHAIKKGMMCPVTGEFIKEEARHCGPAENFV